MDVGGGDGCLWMVFFAQKSCNLVRAEFLLSSLETGDLK